MTIELQAAEARVVVDPQRGGRIRSLVIGGDERLVQETEQPGDDATLWGSFVMAPWAGRLAGARFAWKGREHVLRPNLGPHAIHGLVFDAPWDEEQRTTTSLSLACRMGPLGWPFGGVVRQRVVLHDDRLQLTLQVEAEDEAMPAAVGWHPWWRRPAQGDPHVQVLSDTTLVTTGDLVPTGEREPVAGERDLREAPALGARRLDDVYADAASPARIRLPDLEIDIELGSSVSTVVVYSPSQGFCVEPQSAWPDAINLAHRGVHDTGIAVVEPGGTFSATTTWVWRPV